MDLKRAALIGALGWMLVFIEVSILMFGLKLQPGVTYYFAHYIISIFIVCLCAWIYFNKRKMSAKEGAKLGLVFVGVGLILDAIITVPLFIHNYWFFFNPYLWVGYFETILVASLYPSIKKLFVGHEH